MSVSTLYKADTLEMGKGSFIGLCQKRGVEISRMGTTFGVSAVFPVLSISHFGHRSNVSNWLSCGNPSKRYEIVKNYMTNLTRRLGKNVKLVLPAMQASSLVNVSRAVGLGGGEHEVGHIIFDMAGTSLDRETYNKIDSELHTLMVKGSNSNVDYWNILPKWVNICADIRLEWMLRQVYPESYVRLQSLAEWVWELESRTREEMDKLGVSALGMVIRDLGFNHKSKSQNDIFNTYKTKAPEIWDLAMDLKKIWSKLQVVVDKNKMKKGTDREIDKISAETVHLPLLVACQLLNRLHDLKQQQEPQDQPQEPQYQPQDQPQDQPQYWDDEDLDDEDLDDDGSDDVENEPNEDQDQPNKDDDDDCNGGKGGDDGDDKDQDNSDGEGQDKDAEDGADNSKDEEKTDDGDGGDVDDEDKTDDGDGGDVDDDGKTGGGNSPDRNDDLGKDDADGKPCEPSNGSNSKPIDLSGLDKQPQALNISEAFQNQFDKLKSAVDHKIYIDNGLPVIELPRF